MAQPQPPPVPGPSTGPPYPAPYSPPYAPPPYYPPPPKTTNVVLIIVVVVIIVVAVTVVLAAILYIMVSGLISSGGDGRPVITLSTPTITGASAAFSVVGASRTVPLSEYNANLFVNSTVGTSRPLTASFTITVGSDSFQVAFTDVQSDGLLGAGDRFQINAVGGWRASTTYQFELLWTDLSPVAFVGWST